MRVAELIEGDIFNSFFDARAEPFIDEGCPSLDRIGCRIRECDEVHRVIVDVVETSESCDCPSFTVHEPLSHLVRIK